jgi:hypothetical protein
VLRGDAVLGLVLWGWVGCGWCFGSDALGVGVVVCGAVLLGAVILRRYQRWCCEGGTLGPVLRSGALLGGKLEAVRTGRILRVVFLGAVLMGVM